MGGHVWHVWGWLIGAKQPKVAGMAIRASTQLPLPTAVSIQPLASVCGIDRHLMGAAGLPRLDAGRNRRSITGQRKACQASKRALLLSAVVSKAGCAALPYGA